MRMIVPDHVIAYLAKTDIQPVEVLAAFHSPVRGNMHSTGPGLIGPTGVLITGMPDRTGKTFRISRVKRLDRTA